MAPLPRPFTISIFLPDGIPDGVRIVRKSNWTGVGVVCPRSLFPVAKAREEFAQPGVYVLEGPSEEGELPTIYIGEGDPVRPRLDSHFAKKDFWTRVVFFVSKDRTLNKAHVQYLESRLIALAREMKRANLDNGVGSTPPTLTEAEIADVESFLEDILSIFPLLGMTSFEKPLNDGRRELVLHIRSKGIAARGVERPGGFVVLKGSTMASREVASIAPYLSRFRQNLVAQGVIQQQGTTHEFVQDYSFNSPSTAAGVVLGRRANGRVNWRDGDGRTLKEIQQGTVELSK